MRSDAAFFTTAGICGGAAQRRLPSFAELDALRQQPGITLGANEWTTDHDTASW
ncbi:MAG TPA: hypothetical protein VKA89_08045 [Solirubrobacterales bacterium]|nr:hypothetical protein [Solirubrobacterales bacterium]